MFVADVYSTAPAEWLAHYSGVKHAGGEVLSTLDDGVLLLRVDPYVAALEDKLARLVPYRQGDLVKISRGRTKLLALAHMLQLHSTILSESSEISIASRGFLSLRATVTAPQWQLP